MKASLLDLRDPNNSPLRDKAKVEKDLALLNSDSDGWTYELVDYGNGYENE